MANKKEMEIAELHKTIWRIANDLRGSVDGWDFKQYVLGFLFYRFISENLEDYINSLQRKVEPNFNYSTISDEMAENGREDIVIDKGFYILPSELFCNVRKSAKNNKDLNITLANVFKNIEASAKGKPSEKDVQGLFDDLDVNSSKLGNTVNERNEKLVKLLNAIGDLKLGNYQDNTIDAFGDAYEYLMTMYASNAGKSGGEFFTPQEVGNLLTKITLIGKTEINKVYDPACGSGSLLLNYSKILGKENVKQGFYGQEINLTTYNLCRINMFLHNINYNNFYIERGDTLTNPKHWDDEPFDAIVSNPPYAIKWAGDSNPLLINDSRYAKAGVLAPKSKADYAFIMHMLSWLSEKGIAAIVVFPGILYRSGAEKKIRKYLVDNNFVDTIIQLPNDLFFGTSISTCILVLKKSKIDNNILFIDASDDFIRSTNKNKLSSANIRDILKLVETRKEVEYKTKLASFEEVKENDYNLSISTYVEKEDTREKININELNKKIKDIVLKQQVLRTEIDKIVAEIEVDNETK